MFKNYVTHASLNQVLLASKLNEKRKAVRAPELSATFTWDWEHTPKNLKGLGSARNNAFPKLRL